MLADGTVRVRDMGAAAMRRRAAPVGEAVRSASAASMRTGRCGGACEMEKI
jgi:hypothetical protein